MSKPGFGAMKGKKKPAKKKAFSDSEGSDDAVITAPPKKVVAPQVPKPAPVPVPEVEVPAFLQGVVDVAPE